MLNILFIACTGNIDYECHCLFHGLHELNDVTVYTLNDQPYMFSDYPSEKRASLYGMGFTIATQIDPQKKSNQTKKDVEECIKNHFYDCIIYGSIHRCLDLWDIVREYYSREQIICVDGEDWIYPYAPKDDIRKARFYHLIGTLLNRKQYTLWYDELKSIEDKQVTTLDKCLGQSIVFKRELSKKYYPEINPISFAIPEKLVLKEIPIKNVRLAHIIPGKLDTYIYKTEDAYFRGYQDAYWGVTFKKAGWDCMRHYEILANGCIPYFPDIDNCPNEIMVPFPKQIIKYTNLLYENNVLGGWEVDYYIKQLIDYTRTYLTTKALANYVLSSIV